ncbi:MAG: DUF3783 domain-containing protein [Lachnospiraceae bacterium]|nr:DUF3783 domain-containing protein [Lachnospiraceae bacterium]
MKTIYAHIIDTDKLNSIKDLCAKLDINIELVGYNELGRTVLDIISEDDTKLSKGIKSANKVFISNDNTVSLNIPLMYNMPEVMIFKGFDEQKLKYFLNEYRQAGIEKVELKAMITPYNVAWTLYFLIEHLKKEALLNK